MGYHLKAKAREAILICRGNNRMGTANMNRRVPLAAELVNFLLGISVALAPFVLGFTRSIAKWNNIAIGVALVLVALLSRWRNEVLGLAVLVAGWLFWSPFILGFSTAAFLAANVTMAFVVIAAAASSDGLSSPKVPEASPPARYVRTM